MSHRASPREQQTLAQYVLCGIPLKHWGIIALVAVLYNEGTSLVAVLRGDHVMRGSMATASWSFFRVVSVPLVTLGIVLTVFFTFRLCYSLWKKSKVCFLIL